MRVIHVVPALFGAGGGIFGGAERYVFELARHMARIEPTRLVSFGPVSGQQAIDGLEIRILGGPWYVRGQRANPLHLGLLREIARAGVIHCHQTHLLASSLVALVGRLTRRRVFTTELGGGGWDLSAYVPTDRWYSGHLHISEYSRAVSGHTGRPWAHVIYGGVDTEKFSPAEEFVAERHVLYVGRLLPHKGVNYLIEAVPPDLPLEIIGKPYHRDFLADLKRLAAGKRVVFRHEFDDAELVRAYRRALCVVLPSVYRGMYGQKTRIPELLGLTLLEGMACGLPVVCTNVASMPEVVQEGVTGFIVPPNDAVTLREKLCWLRGHPAETRAMGQAGREYVLDRFTWPAVARRCLEIYAT